MTNVDKKEKKSRKRKSASKSEVSSEAEVKKKEDEDVSQPKKIKSSSSGVIVEQLVNTDKSVVLNALASLADDDDKVEEFFAKGGNVKHLLHLLVSSEEKAKANDVACVFSAVESVINYRVRDADVDGAGVTGEIVKRVLSEYGAEIVLLLSGTNTAHQAKTVLRMLTSFVMVGDDEAR